MEGYLFFFIHLDRTVPWRERALLGLILRLFYLVTVRLQQSHGVTAVPLSQLCLSPLLGKDDGSCFPHLLTGSCDAQAGFQQVPVTLNPQPCLHLANKPLQTQQEWGKGKGETNATLPFQLPHIYPASWCWSVFSAMLEGCR